MVLVSSSSLGVSNIGGGGIDLQRLEVSGPQVPSFGESSTSMKVFFTWKERTGPCKDGDCGIKDGDCGIKDGDCGIKDGDCGIMDGDSGMFSKSCHVFFFWWEIFESLSG